MAGALEAPTSCSPRAHTAGMRGLGAQGFWSWGVFYGGARGEGCGRRGWAQGLPDQDAHALLAVQKYRAHAPGAYTGSIHIYHRNINRGAYKHHFISGSNTLGAYVHCLHAPGAVYREHPQGDTQVRAGDGLQGAWHRVRMCDGAREAHAPQAVHCKRYTTSSTLGVNTASRTWGAHTGRGHVRQGCARRCSYRRVHTPGARTGHTGHTGHTQYIHRAHEPRAVRCKQYTTNSTSGANNTSSTWGANAASSTRGTQRAHVQAGSGCAIGSVCRVGD